MAPELAPHLYVLGGGQDMSKHVVIYVVTYDGTIEPETGAALKREVAIAEKAGWNVEFGRWIGDALIATARNGVVHKFMQIGASRLFFWDSDVVPEEGAMLKLIEKPVDIVCGCYRRRTEEEVYPLLWLHERAELNWDKDTELLEVAAVPMGFTSISRDALRRMSFYFADRKYHHPALNDDVLCLFDCGLDKDPYGHDKMVYWGEDTTFCKRWRMTNGQVWVDPMMKVDHIGFVDPMEPSKGKKIFPGHLGNHLRNRQKAVA